MSLRRRRPPQWLILESSKAIGETIAISITRTTGAPTAAWRVSDGGQIYEYSGDSLSHVVQVGPCKIECRIAPKWIETLTANDQSLTTAKNLDRCLLMAELRATLNPALVLDLSDLPRRLEYVDLDGDTLITGTLSDLPDSPDLAYFNSCISLSGTFDQLPRSLTKIDFSYCGFVGGDLADLPPLLLYGFLAGLPLIIGDLANIPTSVTRLNISGAILIVGSDISHLTGGIKIELSDCNLSQARINAIIDDIYAAKSILPTGFDIRLDGINASPSSAQEGKIGELTSAPYNWTVAHNS